MKSRPDPRTRRPRVLELTGARGCRVSTADGAGGPRSERVGPGIHLLGVAGGLGPAAPAGRAASRRPRRRAPRRCHEAIQLLSPPEARPADPRAGSDLRLAHLQLGALGHPTALGRPQPPPRAGAEASVRSGRADGIPIVPVFGGSGASLVGEAARSGCEREARTPRPCPFRLAPRPRPRARSRRPRPGCPEELRSSGGPRLRLRARSADVARGPLQADLDDWDRAR